MPDGVNEAESTLMKYNPLTGRFQTIQGYNGLDDGEKIISLGTNSLTTRNPQRVLEFKINFRQFVLFANYHQDKFDPEEKEGHSYLYAYDYESEELKLVQKILSFRAIDAAVLYIQDPFNSLNSQWFLILAVESDGSGNKLDSLVYKYVRGQFIPYQSIAVPGAGLTKSVAVYSKSMIDSDNDHVLNHLVCFLSVDSSDAATLHLYQFDGYNIVWDQDVDLPNLKTHASSSSSSSTQTPIKILSSPLSSLNDDAKVISVLYSDGDKRDIPVGKFSDSATLNDDHHQVSKTVRSFVDEALTDIPQANYESLSDDYQGMPKPADEIMILDHVTFDAGATVNVKNDVKVSAEYCSMDDDGNCVKDTEIIIEDKTPLNTATIDGFNLWIDGESNPHSLEQLQEDLSTLRSNIADDGIDITESATLDININFDKKLTVNNVEAKELNIVSEDKSVIQETSDSSKVDLIKFIEEAIQIPSVGDSTLVLPQDMVFENLKINEEYSIRNLNGDSLGNYWQPSLGKTVLGTTSFSEGAAFYGEVDVDGLVGGVDIRY